MASAIRTTPKLALRAAFGLLNIADELKIKATMELSRLYTLNQWNTDPCDFIRKWQEETLNITSNASDCDWQGQTDLKPIKIIPSSVQDWRADNINVDGLKAYTDASVDIKNNRTGIGVFAPDLNIVYAGYASTTMSSFKGELLAMNKFFSDCINAKIHDVKLTVMTDSESSLKALKNTNCRSRIQAGIKKQISILESRNVDLSFIWIPAHTENRGEHFDGNRKADELTRDKNAKLSSLIASAPLTRREKKLQLREKLMCNEKWPETTHQVSKAFKLDKLLQKKEDLTRFNRRDFTLLIRFTTGFSCLGQHMKYVLDLINTKCRFCHVREHTDSSQHIIEECARFNTARLRCFGKLKMKLNEETFELDDILRFIKSTPTLITRLMTWTNTEQEAIQIIEERDAFNRMTLTERMYHRNVQLNFGNLMYDNQIVNVS